MPEKGKDAHSSYFGIEKVSYSPRFERDLDEKFALAKENGFGKVSGLYEKYEKKYKYVKILDTFITGFNKSLLTEIIQESRVLGYSIQIILLNPFSELARIRSETLKENNYLVKLNRGLDKIRLALEGRVADSEIFSGSSSDTKLLLKEIKTLREEKGIDLEIRFTSQLTELPVYIFSQYATKGLIVLDSPAESNPWLFLIDDPLKADDLYDVLNNNFISLWDNDDSISSKLLETKILDEQIPSLETIREMIGENLLDDVLDLTKNYINANFPHKKSYHNERIAFLRRWNELKTHIRNHVFSHEDLAIQKNRFVSDLQLFLNSL